MNIINKTKTILVGLILSLLLPLTGSAQGRPLRILQINPDPATRAMGNTSLAGEQHAFVYANSGAFFDTPDRLNISVSTEIFHQVEGAGREFYGALAAGYKICDKHAILVGSRYLGGHKIAGVNALGEVQKKYLRPFELGIDLSYAYQISEGFNTYATASFVEGYSSKVNYNYLFGVGVNYAKMVELSGMDAHYRLSMQLSDFGASLYFNKKQSFELPTRVALGGLFSVSPTAEHRFLIATQGEYFIKSSQGKQVNFGIGAEYRALELFSLRCGYYNGNKGISYVSSGAGVNYRGASLNLSYEFGIGAYTENRFMGGLAFGL